MHYFYSSELSHLWFTSHRSNNILNRLRFTDKIMPRYLIYLMACATLHGCFFTTILIVLPATLNLSFFNICSTVTACYLLSVPWHWKKSPNSYIMLRMCPRFVTNDCLFCLVLRIKFSLPISSEWEQCLHYLSSMKSEGVQWPGCTS